MGSVSFSGKTSYLFPDETGLGVDPRPFQRPAVRLVTRRIGAEFTLHRVRSLLGSLYAEAHPGDERTAQLKLGHKDVRAARGFYLAPQQKSAIRRFDKLIDSLVAGQMPGKVTQPAKGACHDTL